MKLTAQGVLSQGSFSQGIFSQGSLSQGSWFSNNSEAQKSAGSESRDFSIALLVDTVTDPWLWEEIRGFQAACRENSIQLILMNAKLNSSTMLSNVDAAIRQDVDAVAVSNVSQRMSPLIIDRIFTSGKAVISLNYKLIDQSGSSRQLAPHFGVDYRQAGESAGNWLAAEAIQNRWFQEPSINPGIAVFQLQGVRESRQFYSTLINTLKQAIPQLEDKYIHVVSHSYNNPLSSMISMQELITKHPEVTNWIIAAHDDAAVFGAARALEQVAFGAYGIGMGVNGGYAVQEFSREEITPYRAVYYVDAYAQGKKAAETLISYLKKGTPLPIHTIPQGQIINRDNFRSQLLESADLSSGKEDQISDLNSSGVRLNHDRGRSSVPGEREETSADDNSRDE